MKENQPSATAQRVAMQRAAHQLIDNPKVFDDPIALRIIGSEGGLALKADPNQSQAMPFSTYVRALVAARSRYTEDELALAVQRGVCQYVILGAGLDTFAYRNPFPEGTLRVFEVDHPATQGWKRMRLKEAGITLPRDLTFAPVDFESQTIADGLLEAGYDPGKRTFFSWLGVTFYLTIEAVMTTLRFVATTPVGSGVVFDYAISPSLQTEDERVIFDAVAELAASFGEPFQAFFDPESLTRDLRSIGFRDVKDVGHEEINEKYFKNRTDNFRVGSLARLISAQV